jgi:F-box and WD-40 domain protein CDC4
MNWRSGGHLLRSHRLPVVHSDSSGVITSVALDAEWVVVGLANCKILVFSAVTGVLTRTLVGHDLGVWAVNLVSRDGYWGGSSADEGMEAGGSGQGQPGRRRSGSGTRGRRWRSADLEELGEAVARMTVSVSVSAQGLAGVDVDAHGLEHSVPPSLRYTLGLGIPRVRRPEAEMGDEEGVGKRSDPAGASEGWGQPNALVVSGGCDKVLRVWDVKTG